MKTNPNFKTIHYADGSSMSYIPQPIFGEDVDAPAETWLNENGEVIKTSTNLPDYLKQIPPGITKNIPGYKLYTMEEVEKIDKLESLMKRLYRNLNDPRVDVITKFAAWLHISFYKMGYFICLYKDNLIKKLKRK